MDSWGLKTVIRDWKDGNMYICIYNIFINVYIYMIYDITLNIRICGIKLDYRWGLLGIEHCRLGLQSKTLYYR